MVQTPQYVRLDHETQAFFSLAAYHAQERVKKNGGSAEIIQEDTDFAAMEQLVDSAIAQSHLQFVKEMCIQ